MQAIEPPWATRFYGMTVSKEVAAAARDHLTDRSIADLVDAHLSINQAYFGGIDKTLAGFVILDDEGDDYTLLDLRDSGAVYFQNHEDRELSLKEGKPKPTRKVASTTLCERYQWLVWTLAVPLMRDGKPTQTTDYLVRNGIGRFRYLFPRKDAHDELFEAELPLVPDDPHLAIYWLLHMTMLADDERRDRVVATVGKTKHELLRAFVDRFGALPAAGDIPSVPDFRARRALAITYGPIEVAPDDIPALCLRALEISPSTKSLVHALQVISGLDRTLDDATVAATLARIPDGTPGTALLRAMLDKRKKESSSLHADALARLLVTADDPWWTQLEALWHVHELAYDGKALVAATRRIVEHDRYHRRALQMAMRAAQIANEMIDSIYADLGVADAVLGPYTKLVEEPEHWKTTISSLALPHLKRALAWRVLQRVEINKPVPELAAWAAGEVLASNDPKRAQLVGDAMAKLDPHTQTQVIETAGTTIDGPDHPLVGVLIAFLDGPEPDENDYAAQFALKRGKEAALQALAPWARHAVLFDKLMALVERPGSGSFVDQFFNKLFSPFEKKTYILPQLDDAQAVRVAKAMVRTKLRHPNIHARNGAGHQLYRFNHYGAEAFLIDALTDYSVRYAAVRGPGGAILDRGKTENDQLEDLVANLYAAVRNLDTPASRAALVERLFAERRSYWRMANAIGEIWTPDLHHQVMAVLGERRDARAAGCYAYALHDFVKQSAPLVELARLIVEWQGDNTITNGFLHYALIVGMLAALDARDYELVRRTHDAASWIGDPPLEPDDHSRGRTWANPLDDVELKARLDAALSGTAERERDTLVTSLAELRAKNKPQTKINDEQLGQLAGGVLAERVLTDPKTGEVWFTDREKRMHYFDGYGVGLAPAAARLVTHEGAKGELSAAPEISERVLWWDEGAASFRDVVRLGATVMLSWGVNNGRFDQYVLVFMTPEEAGRFVAQLRKHPPTGYTANDPFYVAGKGAVVRTYYAAGEGAERERHVLWLLDETLCDEDVGSAKRAIILHEERELTWLRGGGVMTTLEWMGDRRRREDLTVREWLKKRIRSDRRDPRWHLDALTEIADYFDEHNLTPKGFAVELGDPANDVELKALAAARTQPIPDSLRALWAAHRSASWKLGKRGMRLLAPREMLDRRAVARAAGEVYLTKLPPDIAQASAPLYGSLDVLVETLAGEPATFIADVARDDGRVFSHAAEHPNDFWWEVALSWMLATRFLSALDEALADAVPAIETLRYGEKVKPRAAAKAKAPPKAKATSKPKAKAATPKQKPATKPKKPTPKPGPKKGKAAAKPKPKKPASKPKKKR